MSVKIPYAYSNGTLSVEVRLKHAADVFLVDTVNYHKYLKGERFKYYGGHYTRTPVRITVSGVGNWYLIVRGSEYEYRFY